MSCYCSIAFSFSLRSGCLGFDYNYGIIIVVSHMRFGSYSDKSILLDSLYTSFVSLGRSLSAACFASISYNFTGYKFNYNLCLILFSLEGILFLLFLLQESHLKLQVMVLRNHLRNYFFKAHCYIGYSLLKSCMDHFYIEI